MAKKVRRKRATSAGNHRADNSGLDTETVRTEDAQKDLAAQERKEFMQRRAAEEKELAKSKEVKSYHYVLVDGYKLLKKVVKANGSGYSFYIGNAKKYPYLLDDQDVKANLKK